MIGVDGHLVEPVNLFTLAEGNDDEFKTMCILLKDLYGSCSPTGTMAIDNIFIYKVGQHLELSGNKTDRMNLLPGWMNKNW